MPTAHQAPPAVVQAKVRMLRQHSLDFRLDRLGQQPTRTLAQNVGQRIFQGNRVNGS